MSLIIVCTYQVLYQGVKHLEMLGIGVTAYCKEKKTQPLSFIISQFSFSTGQKIYSLGLSVQSIGLVIILESPGTKEFGVSWKANESGCEFGLESGKIPEAIELAN